MSPPERARSAVGAAILSFLWPGLGQWYAGRRRDALLFAVPILLLVAAVLYQATGGLTALAAKLLDPSFSLTLLVVIGLAGLWRILSIADVGLRPRGLATLRTRAGAVLVVLAVLVVGTHALAGYYAWSFYDASTKIFVGTKVVTPGASGQPTPLPSDPYNVPPFESPPPPGARITILITGVDKTVERNHSLTDSLLVASIDPANGNAAMVSFPRDLAGFPMYNGRIYNGKINSLMEWAAANPGDFPDGPLPTLAHELSFLLGIPIEYYAAVDLDGFRTLVDAVGGITISVQAPINDPSYSWLDGTHGFFLSAGEHHLDGRTALAFVRSRKGDSDFARAGRQQQLLVALEKKLSSPAMINQLPAILQAASTTIRTNFPADQLQSMIALAEHLGSDAITRVVLQPEKYSFHPPTNTTGGSYQLRLKWDAVKALSVQLFGADSRFWTGSPGASPIAVGSPGP